MRRFFLFVISVAYLSILGIGCSDSGGGGNRADTGGTDTDSETTQPLDTTSQNEDSQTEEPGDDTGSVSGTDSGEDTETVFNEDTQDTDSADTSSGTEDPGVDTDYELEPFSCEAQNMGNVDPGWDTDVKESTCTVTKKQGSTSWAILGTVVSPDEVISGGVVVFDSETHKITCVGEHSACDTTGVSTIECTGAIIAPGLIDTHNHVTYNSLPRMKTDGMLFSRRYDWRSSDVYSDYRDGSLNDVCANTAVSEVMAALGATTVVQSNGSIDYDCGDRASGLVRNWLSNKHDFDGAAPPSVCRALDIMDNSSVDDKCDGRDRIHLHVAEGVDKYSAYELSAAESAGYLHDGLIAVHGVGFTAFELGKLAAAGASLVWSPRNSIYLYNAGPDIAAAKKLGVKIALAPDWAPTGGVNMLSELKCADALNANFYGKALSDKELVEASTSVPGEIMGMGRGDAIRIGRLEVGFYADIAVFAGDPSKPYRSIIEATPLEVLATVVGGEVIAGQEEIVVGMKGDAHTCSPLEMAAGDKTFTRFVCLKDSGYDQTLDELVSFVYGKYAGKNYAGHAYYESEDEVRLRLWTDFPQEATSVCGLPVLGDDSDRDGVSDEVDNCADLYNPEQRDFDRDGLGDGCDPCPLALEETCGSGDIDGDGTGDADEIFEVEGKKNYSCAVTPGHNDTCGACVAGQTCKMSVYDLVGLTGTWSEGYGTLSFGATVELSDVVVIAISGDSKAWVAEKGGGAYSGIMVYGRRPNALQLNQVVDVSGRLVTYNSGSVMELAASEQDWTLKDVSVEAVPYQSVYWRHVSIGAHDGFGRPTHHVFENSLVDMGEVCVDEIKLYNGKVDTLTVTPCECSEEQARTLVSFFYVPSDEKPADGAFSIGDRITARGLVGYYRGVQVYAITSADVSKVE